MTELFIPDFLYGMIFLRIHDTTRNIANKKNNTIFKTFENNDPVFILDKEAFFVCGFVLMPPLWLALGTRKYTWTNTCYLLLICHITVTSYLIMRLVVYDISTIEKYPHCRPHDQDFKTFLFDMCFVIEGKRL